jgi:stage III sporulation protein AA
MSMTTTENGLNVLPAELRAIVEQVSAAVLAQLEEVRVRQGRALEISYGGTFAYVCADGRLTGEPHEAYKPTEYVCQKMLERATNHSLYAVEEELRRGFITVAGGHRIGIAGRTIR